MSDSSPDEVDEIRKQKRERLKAKLGSPDEPIHIEGHSHLDEVVGQHAVVLVDFYADWCGPCKMLEPVVESIAADTAAAVAKVDVDAHQELAAEFNVQGVPMLALFADGQQVEQLVGVQDEDTLVSLVEQYA